LSLLFALRMVYFLKGYTSTNSLISMISTVLRDMQSFVIIMIINIFWFAMAIFMLENARDQGSSSGIVTLTAFLTPIKGGYLSLLGDTTLNELGENTIVGVGVFWVLYVGYSFFMVVVMLNLLIAIMSDTFDRVQAMKLKRINNEFLKLIVEYESMIMSTGMGSLSGVLTKSKGFGDHIYVVRSAAVDEDATLDFDNIWEGKLKEIARDVKRNSQSILDSIKKSKRDSDSRLERLESDLAQFQMMTSKKITQLQTSITEVRQHVGKSVREGIVETSVKVEKLFQIQNKQLLTQYEQLRSDFKSQTSRKTS